MRKKSARAMALLVLLFLLSGCQTIQGAAKGGAEGAKKDWESLKKADAKMREVLW